MCLISQYNALPNIKYGYIWEIVMYLVPILLLGGIYVYSKFIDYEGIHTVFYDVGIQQPYK